MGRLIAIHEVINHNTCILHVVMCSSPPPDYSTTTEQKSTDRCLQQHFPYLGKPTISKRLDTCYKSDGTKVKHNNRLFFNYDTEITHADDSISNRNNRYMLQQSITLLRGHNHNIGKHTYCTFAIIKLLMKSYGFVNAQAPEY